MARRLSSAEKGKGPATEPVEPPRKARVRIQEPDTSAMLHKHSLTLIGRVTNPSAQKVWTLIPFFTDLWKTEIRPVGADLGQGMFKFQFELESDLNAVLENRPYHYGRWMVILQKWEPTISPNFPSLIPFWIKVQGIPIHLWTEGTLRSIGEDIGFVEMVEITPSAARMRVQVNGRLPLIKTSTIEYLSGGEVTAHLVYEKLERHCSMCFRLDHELRDCLEAKAQKKRQQQEEEENNKGTAKQLSGGVEIDNPPHKQFQFTSKRHEENYKHGQRQNPLREDHRGRNNSPEERRPDYYSRENSRASFRAGNNTRRANNEITYRQRSEEEYHRFSSNNVRQSHQYERQRHASKELNRGKYLTGGSYYREISRAGTENKREESSSSKNLLGMAEKGAPTQNTKELIPHEDMAAALDDVRNVMLQYSNVADPTESAARKERLRQAEEKGELEESALRIARASHSKRPAPSSPSPATSQDRVPASQRLGPQSPNLQISQERIPATLRLGPTGADATETEAQLAVDITKRRPGRPPGTKKVQTSPGNLAGTSSKKRKVTQSKAPPCRKRIIADTQRSKQRMANSRESRSQENSQIEDNQPLSTFIPAINKKKKMDFPNPSRPLP
ncbi:hypothetical protein N665_5639s0001 [Sinapis alba]|nr:hypothetical protein N665_5639s0001 [Sinapis alba]